MVSNCALQYLIGRLFQGLHPHQTFNINMMQVLEQKLWLHLLEFFMHPPPSVTEFEYGSEHVEATGL